MRVYVVIDSDRHRDPIAEVFYLKDRAVEYARNAAWNKCKYKENFQEIVDPDWIYGAGYSTEPEDMIWVTEKQIQQ